MKATSTLAIDLAKAFIKEKKKYYHLIYADGTEEALDIIVKPHKEA